MSADWPGFAERRDLSGRLVGLVATFGDESPDTPTPGEAEHARLARLGWEDDADPGNVLPAGSTLAGTLAPGVTLWTTP